MECIKLALLAVSSFLEHSNVSSMFDETKLNLSGRKRGNPTLFSQKPRALSVFPRPVAMSQFQEDMPGVSMKFISL